ncbi:hypothetical protein GCM10027079_20510 [Sediminivirga luteola]|uniref:Uncharacterized protein n=1 Tax=Sediminivirga luteola TaxID=1774748 RepID=A0A8J2TWU9_9MICO|nr:hypothetical protein GCM10011333_09090 [Sediminivirga luteola]
MGEHVVEADHRHRQGEHDPEQPPELPDVIAMTRMAVMAAVVVVTVRCALGSAVIRVIRVMGVAGVVPAVAGGVFVHVRLSDVPALGGGAGGVAAASQGAGCISLSTTHLWLVMVMPPASTSTT